MIFRAVFWIGLVSLLTPHEPDLGLGRPGAGTSLPSVVSSAVGSWAVTGLSRPANACDGLTAACAGGPGSLATLHDDTVRGLAQVKAEIDASIKARANQTNSL